MSGIERQRQRSHSAGTRLRSQLRPRVGKLASTIELFSGRLLLAFPLAGVEAVYQEEKSIVR